MSDLADRTELTHMMAQAGENSLSLHQFQPKISNVLLTYFNLSFEGGVDYIHIIKELFSQPKLHF